MVTLWHANSSRSSHILFLLHSQFRIGSLSIIYFDGVCRIGPMANMKSCHNKLTKTTSALPFSIIYYIVLCYVSIFKIVAAYLAASETAHQTYYPKIIRERLNIGGRRLAFRKCRVKLIFTKHSETGYMRLSF